MRIYADTSVFGGVFDEEFAEPTKQFFSEIDAGRFTIVTSRETLDKENRRVTSFRCDGRIYCSQMTSCDEATFFLRNCPDVKMDGNNDGVPCEKNGVNNDYNSYIQ